MTSTRPAALALLLSSACQPDPAGDEAGTETETIGTSESEGETTDDESESESETGDPPLPGSCAEPIPAVDFPDARLSVDVGGILRDAAGRDVVLRGVNTGNRNKTPPFIPFPITDDIPLDQLRPLADEYFGRMREWGLDTARLPFSWEALEPVRDEWDEQYLDRYEVLVDAAWGQGLRVILDFHQDVWSRNYCGDGFPTWAVVDPDAPWHECPDAQWGLKYVTDTDVRLAFDRFWANEDGLKDEFLVMWTKVGERFADHPGVLALEILNEPGWGTANDVQQWKLDVLTPFHTAVAEYLHELAPDLLIVYDNPGIDAVGLYPEMVHPRPEGDFLIYGPHMYGAGTYGPQQPSPQEDLTEMAAFGQDADVPVMLGEFGFQPNESAGPDWLNEVAEGLDTLRMSATLWEYSINDPLWNYENFSLLDAQANPQPMLDVWVRPWLRAVAGEDPSFAWDPDVQQGSASWIASEGVTEIILPRRSFGEGPSDVTITGEGACFTLDMDRGELRVRADPGATVEVAFTR
jgi:endoglycosylceramidase